MSHLKALSLAAPNGQQVVPDLRQLCPLLYQQLRTFCGAQQQLQPRYHCNTTADNMKQQCSNRANAPATADITAGSLFSALGSALAHQNALLANNSYSVQGLPRQRAGRTTVGSQQVSFLKSSAAGRCFTTSSTCSTNEAESIGSWPSAPNSIPQNAQVSIVEDTLKLAALLRRFRDRGHLIAQLDPLKRTAGGPWLGPIGDEYTRSDHTLMRLVTEYPAAAPATQRCAFIADQLGLVGRGDPGRLFAVGQLMPGKLCPC